MHERRDVAKAHGSDHASLDASPGLEPAGGDVDDDPRLGLLGREPAALERPRDERDRPVAAGGRIALVVEEDDAEVGAVVLRLGDEAAVHVRVAARLVDEQLAHVVEMLQRKTALVENRAPRGRLDAAGDDPKRLAARVVVDGLDVQRPVKRGRRFSPNAVTPSAKSSVRVACDWSSASSSSCSSSVPSCAWSKRRFVIAIAFVGAAA